MTAIEISEAQACTPAYPTLEDMWFAWRDGQAPDARDASHGVPDWEGLTHRVMDGLRLPDHSDYGLILATTKGDMTRQEEWMRALDLPPRNPLDRSGKGADCGLSMQAAILSRRRRLGGPAYVVSTACSSGLTALIEAALLVQAGQACGMVVCGADVASGFVRDGFAAFKAITTQGACRPFDRERDGLMLGSGAAACIVRTLVKGPIPSVVVSGWGMSGDAVHMTAPDRHAGGLTRAIRGALAMAGLVPGDIDAIVAHGTGTRYNDAMETVAFEGEFAKTRPAVTCLKGLFGHTLGAAGLIETLLACRMMRDQVVPAITGLRQPESAVLNLVIGESRPMRLRHVLKTSSGFGGLNAAVVLSLIDPVSSMH